MQIKVEERKLLSVNLQYIVIGYINFLAMNVNTAKLNINLDRVFLNPSCCTVRQEKIWTWRLVTVWWSVPVSLLERCTCVESKLDTSRMFLLMR